MIVGTHAVIQKGVEYHNLGIAITDEQHRFGVRQRSTLAEKGDNVHTLVMTATPIPRTLAMTLYGDLDVSVIDELPPGRKPIQTIHQFDNRRPSLYAGIRKQIEEQSELGFIKFNDNTLSKDSIKASFVLLFVSHFRTSYNTVMAFEVFKLSILFTPKAGFPFPV